MINPDMENKRSLERAELSDDLEAIFKGIRNLVSGYREMGFDPPMLSRSLRNVLEKEIAGGGVPDLQEESRSLASLEGDLEGCRKCKLHAERRAIVFGEGSPSARLVFVGEGPGRGEDLAGRPFVGEAGELLTRIIERGMEIPRDEVYIANIVKCRPPRNRDPEPDEIEACLPVLKEQLRLIGPEVICCLGNIAGRSLLGFDFVVSRDRGTWRSYMGIPVMPTFHPAYIVRNPGRARELKGLVWQDVKEIMRKLGLQVKGRA